MVTDDEAHNKIKNEPDFVNIRRFAYSLSNVRTRYPDGAPDHIVATALMIPEAEVTATYERIVNRLREIMGLDG